MAISFRVPRFEEKWRMMKRVGMGVWRRVQRHRLEVEKNSTGSGEGFDHSKSREEFTAVTSRDEFDHSQSREGFDNNSQEKNSTTTIEEKEEETYTITTKRKDIERLQERLFVRIFIERVGHAVLKKQNVLESQVLKILQGDKNRLTAAALRILFFEHYGNGESSEHDFGACSPNQCYG